MNAHAKPPYGPPARSAVQRLILEAGRLVGLANSIGECSSPEDADRQAEGLEEAARNMGDYVRTPTNTLDRMLGLEIAGNYAMRARLYRDRARELRS
jgi:hypothetical protein